MTARLARLAAELRKILDGPRAGPALLRAYQAEAARLERWLAQPLDVRCPPGSVTPEAARQRIFGDEVLRDRLAEVRGAIAELEQSKGQA